MNRQNIKERFHTLWKKNRTISNIGIVGLIVCVVVGGFYWQVSLAKNVPEENWGLAEAKETPVNSKVAGRVVQIYVKEGDTVQQGQLLARIDKDTQETNRTQAEAAL